MSSINASTIAAFNSMDNPSKDGKNPHFGNTYATLGATLAVIRPACAEAGIAYRQRIVEDDDGTTHLVSYVMMGDESTELSRLPIDTACKPQDFGSILTYLRRYLAQLDWGLTGEDDDAESVQSHTVSPKPRQRQKQATTAKQAEKPAMGELKAATSDYLRHFEKEERKEQADAITYDMLKQIGAKSMAEATEDQVRDMTAYVLVRKMQLDGNQ